MDKAVDLLKLLRGKDGKDGANASGGLRIVTAVTSDPSPITFVFEGTSLALDIDVFRVPVSVYPICAGDKFLASPMVGNNTQRFGIIAKINNGVVMGTMLTPTTCQVPGIGRPYTAADLIIPKQTPTVGDKVTLVPTMVGGTIKYAIQQYF